MDAFRLQEMRTKSEVKKRCLDSTSSETGRVLVRLTLFTVLLKANLINLGLNTKNNLLLKS
jgi:hypothetical protein